MRPVCVSCKKELRPEKNDIAVEYLASFGSYQIYLADLWKCPQCGVRIISGFGNGPIAEHFESDYSTKRENCAKENGLFSVLCN